MQSKELAKKQENKINLIPKDLEEPKFHLSEAYYIKLLSKTYNCQIEYKSKHKPNIKLNTSSDDVIDELVSNLSEDEKEKDEKDEIFQKRKLLLFIN